MEKDSFRTFRKETSNEIDEFTLENKLKMIAFQDEIFEARRKLKSSENRLADLQKKLDNYLQNKEHQLAEINITAHMNAQRIEAQARSRTDLIIMEIDEELRFKQQELKRLQDKNRAYLQTVTEPQDLSVDQSEELIQPIVEAFAQEDRELSTPASLPPEAVIAEQKAEIATEASSLEEEQPSSPGRRTEITPKHRRRVKKTAREVGIQPPIVEIAPDQIGASLADQLDQVTAVVGDEQILGQKPGVSLPVTEPGLPAIGAELAPAGYITSQEAPAPVAGVEDVNEKMRLDAFVDVRYYDPSKSQGQLEQHALQVAVEVDVPEDTYSVRYTKVSSDIVSALLHFDNVTLNDVFPFNIIEPNLPNIAMYFYNLLEDILSLMDLGLSSIAILEIPDVHIQVKVRNTGFDNLLHRDEDIYRNLRETMLPCVEPEPDDTNDFRGRLNRLLKKRS